MGRNIYSDTVQFHAGFLEHFSINRVMLQEVQCYMLYVPSSNIRKPLFPGPPPSSNPTPSRCPTLLHPHHFQVPHPPAFPPLPGAPPSCIPTPSMCPTFLHPHPFQVPHPPATPPVPGAPPSLGAPSSCSPTPSRCPTHLQSPTCTLPASRLP